MKLGGVREAEPRSQAPECMKKRGKAPLSRPEAPGKTDESRREEPITVQQRRARGRKVGARGARGSSEAVANGFESGRKARRGGPPGRIPARSRRLSGARSDRLSLRTYTSTGRERGS